MAEKNKKGIDKKEYPKLVKVGDKKVRVLNEAEEKALNLPSQKEEKKPAGWGK